MCPVSQICQRCKERTPLSAAFLLITLLLPLALAGQKHSLNLRDTLDHKLDLSDYVINLKGFVPYPVIISEPALGNFGGALALVFISPRKNVARSEKFHFPDITAVAGMYTLNNSWGAGAIRQGSFPAIGLRYQAALAYASINLNFYREIPYVGEKEFLFTLKPLVVSADLSQNLFRNKIFAGVHYTFTWTKASHTFENLPDSIFSQPEMETNIGMLGLYAEVDTRNTTFTPDRGVRFKSTFSLGRSWTGSDVDMGKIDAYLNLFIQPVSWWVCGFRASGQAISEDAPFYYYPYLDMRGIPLMRYQGQQTLLFETEQRFDLTRRWSLVGFVGSGKTFSASEYLKTDSWVWSGGAGFRYLVARLFGLRMGIDVAAGPGQFAYYIVFGHYWNR